MEFKTPIASRALRDKNAKFYFQIYYKKQQWKKSAKCCNLCSVVYSVCILQLKLINQSIYLTISMSFYSFLFSIQGWKEDFKWSFWSTKIGRDSYHYLPFITKISHYFKVTDLATGEDLAIKLEPEERSVRFDFFKHGLSRNAPSQYNLQKESESNSIQFDFQVVFGNRKEEYIKE